MKPVLAWIKKNVMVVVAVALPLIALPVALYFSMSWNSSIRTTQEKAAADQLGKVTGTKVNYQLPEVLPGVKAVSLSAEPNDKITEYFKGKKDLLLEKAAAINAKGLEFNRRGALMEGVFPKAASREEFQNKSLEFSELIIGGSGRTSVYQRLFESARAGEPMPASQMRTLLTDAKEREEERVRQGKGAARPLTAEEEKDIRTKLTELRKGEYIRKSNELSFYGSPSIALSANAIPAAMPTQPPALEQLFRWQYDYWVVADVVEAIKRVNGVQAGGGVANSVVKRVDLIRVFDRVSASAAGGGQKPESEGEAAAAGGGVEVFNQPAPVSFKASLSGRYGSPSNQVYDVRYADLNMIVSSSRLPEFFDALASVNFMTVLDCDLEAIDPWAELEQGYYFGDEPVVRAKVRVETIWLREWVAPLMPAKVRKLYGVTYTDPTAEVPAEGGEKPAGEPSGEAPSDAPPAGGRGGRPRGGGGG